MQKFIISIVLLLILVETAFAEPLIRLGSLSIPQGEWGEMSLFVNNLSESVAGINAQLKFPPHVTVIGVSLGTDLDSNFVIDWGKFTDGVNIVVYSGSKAVSNNTLALYIGFKVDGDCAPGSYDVVFSDINTDPAINIKHAVSNLDGSKSLAHQTSSGTLTITTESHRVVDNDGDGIDDAWEWEYFFDLTTANRHSDYDNDGFSDLIEYENWAAGYSDSDGNDYDPKVGNSPHRVYLDPYGGCNGNSPCYSNLADIISDYPDEPVAVKALQGLSDRNVQINGSDIYLIFRGGFNGEFSSQDSFSSIQGSIVINDGCLIIERLEIVKP